MTGNVGGQAGNKNATKGKKWREAIDKALKQYNEGDVKAGHALDAIALKLVRKAVVGDEQEFNIAMKEIGDRIDGKAAQSVELAVTDLSQVPTEELMNMIKDAPES